MLEIEIEDLSAHILPLTHLIAQFCSAHKKALLRIRVIENGGRASSQISPATFGGSENETPGQRGAFLGDDCGTRPVELAG